MNSKTANARRYLPVFVGSAILATAIASASVPDEVLEPVLEPQARHEQIGAMVTEFIEQSHYRHASVNDELSSHVALSTCEC